MCVAYARSVFAMCIRVYICVCVRVYAFLLFSEGGQTRSLFCSTIAERLSKNQAHMCLCVHACVSDFACVPMCVYIPSISFHFLLNQAHLCTHCALGPYLLDSICVGQRQVDRSSMCAMRHCHDATTSIKLTIFLTLADMGNNQVACGSVCTSTRCHDIYGRAGPVPHHDTAT